MNYELLIQKAKEKGFKALEIYELTSGSQEIAIYEKIVDRYTSNKHMGVGIRGIYKEHLTNYFIEKQDSDVDDVINHLIENAECLENNDVVLFNDKKYDYKEVNQYNENLNNLDNEEMIKILKDIEDKCLKYDPRITQVEDCTYENVDCKVKIINSYGLDLIRKINYAYIVVGVIANNNGEAINDYEIKIFRDIKDLDVDKLVDKVCKKVLKKLNHKEIKSDNYKIIIENKTMSSLLACLSASFNAENVYKGLSKLKNQLNNKIVDERINIIDDPFLKDGLNSCGFDDEGTPTKTKYIVEKGVLKTYLNNLINAKRFNVEPTGNGFKGSYASNIGISPTNLYIENGSKSFDELLKEMDKGVIITELQGLHAGINLLTLDFSLQASGFYVEDGEVKHAIKLMTVAGNLIDLLNNKVVDLGNDLDFETSGIGSCSILFSGAQIS